VNLAGLYNRLGIAPPAALKKCIANALSKYSVGRTIISLAIYFAKLVIIDLIIVHRAEFAGRGTLADRQQRLNSMLHKIIRSAEILNTAVVITNQVVTLRRSRKSSWRKHSDTLFNI
jgi:hypothetical protein